MYADDSALGLLDVAAPSAAPTAASLASDSAGLKGEIELAGGAARWALTWASSSSLERRRSER